MNRLASRAAAALACLLSSCMSMPGPSAQPDLVEGLRRSSYTAAVAEGDEREVSALWSSPLEPGTGAPKARVIYLHGTPGSADSWADYLIDPVASVEAVAIDRPGFGESNRRPLADLEAQARAIGPLLDGGKPAVIVGHSYGGPVALQAALLFPERVAGVVVIAGSVSPELEELRWFNYLGRAFSLLIPRDLRRANQEVWPLRADLERMSHKLGTIDVPVAIVHGTEDSLVPYGNADFMLGALTAAAPLTLHRLEGGSHFIIWEERWIPRIRSAIEEVLAAL